MSNTTSPNQTNSKGSLPFLDQFPLEKNAILIITLLVVSLFWAYWPTFVAMWGRWTTDPQYSHGFLVPLFAFVVLWSRRDLCPKEILKPSWWGLGFLLIAMLLRFSAAYLYLEPLDGFSLIPMLLGSTLLIGGWRLLRWTWPATCFLAFMLPLPYQVEVALAQPLRGLATVAGTFAMQTVGLPALSEGNLILIEGVRLEVLDACNGLGMLFTFFALSTAVALIIQRPLVDRMVILLSAIPVALIVNILRITITGIFYYHSGKEMGQFIHDFAGWLMMPMALGLLWLELKFLSRLLVEVDSKSPLSVGIPGVFPGREREKPETANFR